MNDVAPAMTQTTPSQAVNYWLARFETARRAVAARQRLVSIAPRTKAMELGLV